MTELQKIKDEILADVVLWDVKQETSMLVMACFCDEADEIKDYLVGHGYDVSTHESYYHLVRIEIRRKS